MSAPFAAHPFTFTNRDGSTVDVLGWGNQFAAVFETPDGYTVVKNPASGAFEYAQPAASARAVSSLEPSGHRVGRADPLALGLAQHLRDFAGAPPERGRTRARVAV